MTTTIDGNFLYYSGGTNQQSANWKVIGGDTDTTGTNFPIGTYMLIDNQTYKSPTSPMPLDGWSSTYTVPVLVASGTLYNSANTGQYLQAASSSTYFGSYYAYAGTWVSRGSCITQSFVVRIA
jgi:hypothetical protein